MVNHPDPAALYPDVARRGSLAVALQAMAEEGGFALSATASTSSPLDHAGVESRLPHRNALWVSSWQSKRLWSIRGAEAFQGMALVEGDTDDLAQVARAAQAWQEGAALSDIRKAAPFVHLTGRSEVPHCDPAHLTESEWQHLRTEAGEQNSPAHHALVEAAYAEPALRGLYPFTSHWALRFSTTTRPQLTIAGPCVIAGYDKQGYMVSEGFAGEGVLARAATAQEAVAAAVRHLPRGLGPVTFGAFPDEDQR
ncbi:DUF6193 family natural product biosynthesis protein [Streptomyces sp. NPDC051907]|uniref:DUF6193 family natural product biosynthesis protein n=1 Tax=Streptomyces sp. NPDC051907 TaxID=3155284 RepID=UPI0034209675